MVRPAVLIALVLVAPVADGVSAVSRAVTDVVETVRTLWPATRVDDAGCRRALAIRLGDRMKPHDYFNAFLENTVNLSSSRLDLLEPRVESIVAALGLDDEVGPLIETYIPTLAPADRRAGKGGAK